MKVVRLLNYLLIWGLLFSLPTSQVKCFDTKDGLYVLASVTGITLTWALIERYKKNNAKFDLNKVSQEVKQLVQEVDNYKKEKYQLEEEEHFLFNVSQFINNIEIDYKNEYIHWKSKSKDKNEYSYHLFNDLLEKIQLKTNLSLDKIITKISEDKEKTSIFLEQLRIKLYSWKVKENRIHFVEKAKFIEEKLEYMNKFLNEYYQAVLEQKNFIELGILLQINYEKKYSKEFEIVKISNLALFKSELDKHIRVVGSKSNEQFPYFYYVQMLNSDKMKFEKFLENIVYVKVLPFQTCYIEKAKEIYDLLNKLLTAIVTTSTYIDEKEKKPIFDREQIRLNAELREKEMRLQAELKEKQAQIENQKKMIETKLLFEKNREQELANQKAKIEKDRKELELKEKQMMVDLAKIRDGETVKEALKQNDRKWQQTIDNLQSKYSAAVRDLNNLSEEHKKEVSKLKCELSDLKAQLKTSDLDSDKTAQEIKRLKDRIKQIITYLSELDILVSNPPFNPDFIEGLRTYIENIKLKISNIKFLCQ